MTTEAGLKTVHMFPSVDSYLNHKSEVAEGDLPLIPLHKIAYTGRVEDLDGKLGEAQIIEQGFDTEKHAWWYRKWSNGWIEQGGRDYSLSWGRTFTFPIPFSDANYIAYPVTHQTGQEQWFYTAIQEQTPTTLKVGSHNCYISYYCCGF